MKGKENLVFVVAALIVGILIGVIFSNLGGNKNSQMTASGQGSTSAPPPMIDYQQNIKVLLDVVAKEPGNHNAWVQLGNNYFDSNQPVQAVDAYAKALELEPNDPDVLTDQGIMFRTLGWFDKAIENFETANKINPQHAQSLFNLGLTYMQDLKDFDNAAKAWEKYLAVNPTGPAADQVRSQLEELKNHPPLESK